MSSRQKIGHAAGYYGAELISLGSLTRQL